MFSIFNSAVKISSKAANIYISAYLVHFFEYNGITHANDAERRRSCADLKKVWKWWRERSSCTSQTMEWRTAQRISEQS